MQIERLDFIANFKLYFNMLQNSELHITIPKMKENKVWIYINVT